MAIHFTPAQQKVLDARSHNILVSAAAGSGKTAVLVERIVRLISEGEHPLDIDRLLVVTFTKAAAAQMRERVGQALTARLREDPGNAHLQRQEVLLHNAQITTMDSFFTFLLRNYFSDIDLEPGFRQIDETESRLIAADVMRDFLEEQYAGRDPVFLDCASYFSPGDDDHELEEILLELCRRSRSHPSPEAWIAARASDYDAEDAAALFSTPWMRTAVLDLLEEMREVDLMYARLEDLCLAPGGPDAAWDFMKKEREGLFGGIRELDPDPGSPSDLAAAWETLLEGLSHVFERYPVIRGKNNAHVDPEMKSRVKTMRDAQKDRVQDLKKRYAGQDTAMILAMMRSVREPMHTLSALALSFEERFLAVKKEKHVIDFSDLEHFALAILAERQADGTYKARRAAHALRAHYSEILIDEYQDSNEVQELLLRIISGEEDGRNNRFMVGDIKQSIYRFRLARPEIFMEKYAEYRPDDLQKERIELDQNFRSRNQVLDCVNAIFRRIMRREVGGVAYTEEVSLKKGAVFPDEMQGNGTGRGDPYCAELLLLEADRNADNGPEKGESPGDRSSADGTRMEAESSGEDTAAGQDPEEEIVSLSDRVEELTERQREALLIAGRIRELVGTLPVRDEETGEMRPARYGDIVILLRTTKGWNEDLRAVLSHEGIPAYAESRAGYFSAEEIREVIALLRVIDNPRQDIPLYGVLRGFFGGFTQDEITRIRLMDRDGQLFDALTAAAGSGRDTVGPHSAAGDGTGIASQRGLAGNPYLQTGTGENDGARTDPALSERCRVFLDFLHTWRNRSRYQTIAGITAGLLEETGYRDYCTALPGGTQRAANLRILQNMADAFAKTDYTGLFQFLRYIDGMRQRDIDYGEANILDENADVVRIMSIHKSKGLEFPICFVAGLSGKFAFRSFDTSGTVLYDGDWGTGTFCYDRTSRVRASTLRREQIAQKIRTDCMGEELRVLYVAMTRAKEKLIMTASVKKTGQMLDRWEMKLNNVPAAREGEPVRLTPGIIGGAASYAELVCEAVMAIAGRKAFAENPQENMREGDPGAEMAGKRENRPEDPEGKRSDALPLYVRLCTQDDLHMQAAEEQLDLEERYEEIRALEGHSLSEQPDPETAQALASVFFRAYPHEELAGLYAHTSVSEIKKRAMRSAALRRMEGEETDGEGPAELFPDATPVPYLPAFFVRDTEAEESRGEGPAAGAAAEKEEIGGEDSAAVTEAEEEENCGEGPAAGTAAEEEEPSPAMRDTAVGALRGTAFHRLLEIMDYRHLDELIGKDRLEAWISSMIRAKRISREEAGLVSRRQLQQFLSSPLAARMAAAEAAGKLFREQPFVMGLPADRIEKEFPGKEAVTVQGTIDAFFLEGDHICLVDYKTDRVRTSQELADRYETQLALYAEALEKAWSLPVTERVIYSTALGRQIIL